MEQQLNIGDVVALKSGGPNMTVEHIDPETQSVLCSWFDGQEKKLSTFPLGALERA